MDRIENRISNVESSTVPSFQIDSIRLALECGEQLGDTSTTKEWQTFVGYIPDTRTLDKFPLPSDDTQLVIVFSKMQTKPEASASSPEQQLPLGKVQSLDKLDLTVNPISQHHLQQSRWLGFPIGLEKFSPFQV